MKRLLIFVAGLLLGVVVAIAQVGTPKTVSALISEINSSFADNTSGLITPAVLRQVTLDIVASTANMVTQDQTLSGGTNVTSFSLGTISSGTTTIDCGKSPLQFFTNNGSFTIASPANDGSCDLLATNGASAGAIVFSGFNVSSFTGEALTTTNTSKFIIHIERINTVSTYFIKALQ